MTAAQPTAFTHRPPPRLTVNESPAGYVIAVDIGDFTQSELEVALADRLVTVTAEQIEAKVDDIVSFRFDDRLEESFRLPEDADPQRVEVFYRKGTLEIYAPKATADHRRIVPIRRKPTSVVNPDAAPC